MTAFKRCFFVTIILFVIVNLLNFTLAQNKLAAPKLEPQVQQIAGLNAKFIVALIEDGLGGAWIGTEDDGVFHYQVDGKISQFTTKNGLGDNNGYGLAIDKLGRLWVGHLNTGVSVFNGKDWKNYDVVDGPIGERIFDIKICPKDGDIWMATSAGISRYKIDSDDWEHLTREDGLLEDQASSLAFKNDGTLIVGTQCHGLAIFNRTIKGEYKHSKNIVAPDRFGQGNISPVPLTPRGSGLPSNLINDIIVTKNLEAETIWIATNAGLVKSNDTFTKLEYWRGKDYVDKVRGLYGGSPKDWQPAPKEIMDQILPEDYLTCLAEDDQGVIWIGTRQNGFYIADPKTGKKAYGNQKGIGLPDNFVTKILILDNGDYLIGSYGGGIVKPIKPYKLVDRKPLKTRFNKDKSFFVAQNKFPKLPSKIKPPTAEELRATFYKLKKTYQKPNHSNILALNDDWRTQGDWIDHYGRHSAVLCAQAGGGLDFFGGYFSHELESRGWIGRNCLHKGDQLRRWVHWIESNDRRVLQCLQLGGRKQAEWDDHKEAYPMNLDGPHIYGTFKIPQGKYILSLYFFNKDGHGGKNRLRDFVVSVKTMKLQKQIFESLGNKNIYAEAEFFNSQNGVNSRVNNFWGGLYKRFFIEVKKDEYITVCVNSNYSFNTIMSGVFFDPAGEMKSLTSLNSPYPPPRQLTKWEEVIESPIEKIWWGLHVLDYLLYLRDSRPTWFYPNSRKSLLPLIRVFIKIEGNKPCSPAEIDAKDKNLIRSDIAKLLNYTQMFYYRDMVDFSGHKQATYWWHERTRIGRSNALNFMWNEMDYMKFWRGKNHDLIW